MTEAVPARSSAQDLCAAIRRQILAGEVPAGDRVVIERLARHHGVSRTPIREALARLHAEGLVEFEPNRGYRAARLPSDEDIDTLFEARLILEVGAVRFATLRIARQDIERLKALNTELGEGSYGPSYEDFQRFVEVNDEFHHTLIAAARNPLIEQTYQSAAYASKLSLALVGRGVPDVDAVVSEHARIIDALERQDSAMASQQLAMHLQGGWRRVAQH